MSSFAQWQRPARDADVATLVARIALGERAALEQLYRREAGAVYRYALALSGNEAWAADATQDAYLAGAARHTLLALWRQARGEPVLQDADMHADAGVDDDAQAADGHDVACPEQLLVRAQSTRELWRALNALPFIYREPVVLVDLQERSYLDAARIAGIELNTLRTRLHRARLRLAHMLGAGVTP